jgi:chorismate synthase
MSFTLGRKFKITVFGESHGVGIGVVIEGCPPGLKIDLDAIQRELYMRNPMDNELTTQRKEKDKLKVFSGILKGTSTGSAIGMMVENKDYDNSVYSEFRFKPRPGHADFTAAVKYKNFNDHRGGGIFSGRITAAFVMAGALAKQILSEKEIIVAAHTIQVGNVKLEKDVSFEDIQNNVNTNSVRCADIETAQKMESEIKNAKEEGDSVGGLVECRITGLSPGMGEPVFDSIESVISHGIFSIPGVKGIEFGSGFDCAKMKGSEHNDSFVIRDERVSCDTNFAGGILGGLSTGMPVVFQVAVKPTSSISKSQATVDLRTMKECELSIKGRHDPCIAIRACVVIESMAAICLVDLLLRLCE